MRVPLLVYDGECGFCLRWVGRFRRLTGGRVRYEPFQTAAERFPEIPRAEFKRAVRLIDPEGRAWAGAAATFQLLRHVRGLAWVWPLYARVPGFARASEAAYRWVADHRSRL